MLGWLNAWAHYAPLAKTVDGHRVEPRPDAAVAGMRVPLNAPLVEVLATMTWAVFA
jgi:hypothetical protein